MTTAPLTRAQLLDVVREAVVVVLEVDAAGLPESALLAEELQADSLAVVELAEVVEAAVARRTGRAVHLADERLDDLRTLGDLVDALAEAGA